MIAKTVLTLMVAFAIGQVYTFFGHNIGWFPFGAEPVFPSIEWVIMYGTVFAAAFFVVWIMFSMIYRSGYKEGQRSLTKT